MTADLVYSSVDTAHWTASQTQLEFQSHYLDRNGVKDGRYLLLMVSSRIATARSVYAACYVIVCTNQHHLGYQTLC